MRYTMASTWKLGRRPRICVVGAGFAGLTCAERLGHQGMDVTIIEARDRVGGRVHQTNTVGHWTDMGANWIHGAHVNPIRDIARKVGAVTLSLDEPTLLYDEDGQPMPQEQAEKLEEITWSIIADAFKHSNSGVDIPVDMSLYDYVVQQLESKDLSRQEKNTVLHMSEMWGGYIGTPFTRQSLKFLFLEASLEGENAFVASTYRDILRHVESRALKHATLYTETEVTAIEAGHTPSSAIDIQTKVSGFRAENMPTLCPSTSYDALIVTVPFGCLKEGQVTFSPQLPPNLNHAIESISYGNLEKVYIRFPCAFWLSNDNPHPFFTHFLHPQYSTQNPKHWDIGLVSLASAPAGAEQTAHPTILFYIYGPCGTHVTNLITGLEPSDPVYMSRLTKFFEPYYSRLPQYDARRSDCTPVAMLATDWQHDRLAGHGSYTNWQIDDNGKLGLPPKMPLDDAITTLREGMPERGIWFAGEHTAPFAALGTVTGAYLSGEAVAERVIEHFRGQDTSLQEQNRDPDGQLHFQVEGSNALQVGKGMQAHGTSVNLSQEDE